MITETLQTDRLQCLGATNCHAAHTQLVPVEIHTSPAVPANPSCNEDGSPPWRTLQGHKGRDTHIEYTTLTSENS